MKKPSGDSGGNMAPSESPAETGGRPRALFLTPEAPYPAIGGGALRSASLLEYLGRRCEVDVIAFREQGSADPAAAFPPGLVRHVHVVDLPYHSRHVLLRIGRNLGRLARAVPPLNDRFRGFEAQIRAHLSGRSYELALLEHFWTASYRDLLARHSKRVILDLHNIESVLLAACARVEPWPVSHAFRRFHSACLRQERAMLPKFDAVLVPSARDARRLDEIAPGAMNLVYPNAIPWVAEPVRAEENAIVFSGNLGYHPNIQAVRFFRRKIWPVLRQRWPSLVWRLVGKDPDGVRAYTSGDPRIEVLGPVANAVEAIAAAKVAVVPVLAGSGTRVKILEAWAAAKAVVSTSLGAEGLAAVDGEHLLLADDPNRFADSVSTLLQSESARRSLGGNARRLYEREFTWEAAWARLGRIGI